MERAANVEELQTDNLRRPKRAGVLRVVLAAAALVALFFLGGDLADYIPRFATWVEGLGLWAPVVYGLGYALATVAFVPGSWLTLAAGAIFGLATGMVTVFIGASVGATLAFLVSRYVARSWVERKLEGHERFAAIDAAVGEQGLKIVALLRLSPVFPFNMLNYALGLTRVSLRDYVIGHLFMLPGDLPVRLLWPGPGHRGRDRHRHATGARARLLHALRRRAAGDRCGHRVRYPYRPQLAA